MLALLILDLDGLGLYILSKRFMHIFTQQPVRLFDSFDRNLQKNIKLHFWNMLMFHDLDRHFPNFKLLYVPRRIRDRRQKQTKHWNCSALFYCVAAVTVSGTEKINSWKKANGQRHNLGFVYHFWREKCAPSFVERESKASKVSISLQKIFTMSTIIVFKRWIIYFRFICGFLTNWVKLYYN